MKSVLIALTSFFLLALFQRCNYVEVLSEKGAYVEIEEWVGEFTAIRVETPIHLILEQTDEQIAVISGLDFKVSNLKFTVENSELILDAKAFALNRKDQIVTVRLPIKALNKITLNVPTQLSSANELLLGNFTVIVNGGGTYSESNLKLNCQSIYIAAFGPNSGLHLLEGKTNDLRLTMEGLSWTDATEMRSSKVTVTQRSLKSSYVNVTDQLTVKMYSSGHVYFTGQPQLDYQIYVPDWEAEFGRAISQSE